MRFSVITADPPVPFKVWGKRRGGIDSRSADAHYDTMTWDDLNNLGSYVQSVADEHCCLFLWICQPLLIETLTMAKAWGFEYKTKAFSWCKTYHKSNGFFVGMGYWTRANTEDVLLFTRGNPKRAHKDVRQLMATLEEAPYDVPAIIAPMTRHSEKPEAMQTNVERLVTGPYLELFARRQRTNWTCVGNEVDGLDIRDSLTRLANDATFPIVAPVGSSQQSLFDILT